MTAARWMDRSLCRIPAYAPLFADRRPYGMSKTKRNAAAKAVCGRCPVLDTCRPWVLEQEGATAASHRAGIIAGLTARERAEVAGADTDADDDASDDQDGAA
jgi:WhiB family redox-sensing transcriptional regulator